MLISNSPVAAVYNFAGVAVASNRSWAPEPIDVVLATSPSEPDVPTMTFDPAPVTVTAARLRLSFLRYMPPPVTLTELVNKLAPLSVQSDVAAPDFVIVPEPLSMPVYVALLAAISRLVVPKS